MKINKKVEYALIALKFMAERKDGKLTTAREICDRFHTPFDTVAKVMQSLGGHHILNSIKGIKGGYELTTDLNALTYMQIENIIEGETPEHICDKKKGRCDLYSTCNIISPIEKLNSQVNKFLSNLTLQELLFEDGESRE